MMAFNGALHPRGTGSKGGQFVVKGSNGQTTHTSQIGYNGASGTGYNTKSGDANVKRLQQELNRLGITDGQGRPLAVDGKFGPKTTAAVRRLQARLGLTVTGKVTPELLAKIRKLKPSAHDAHTMHKQHVANVQARRKQLAAKAKRVTPAKPPARKVAK